MCGRGYQKVYTSSPNVLDEKVYIYIYLFISFTKMFLYYLFILTIGSAMRSWEASFISQTLQQTRVLFHLKMDAPLEIP